MEQRIKDYEMQVEAILKKWDKLSERQKRGWRRYHAEQIKDFQHERAIHLAVTLFFVALALLALGLCVWGAATLELFWLGLWPLVGVTLLLVIVTAFYIKHYYFLENHIQGLYKYNLEFCLEDK